MKTVLDERVLYRCLCSDMCVMCEDRVWREGELGTDYGMNDGSTVHLMKRLRCGGVKNEQKHMNEEYAE